VPPEQGDLAQGFIVQLIGQGRIRYVPEDKPEPPAGKGHHQVANPVALGKARRQGPGAGSQGFEITRPGGLGDPMHFLRWIRGLRWSLWLRGITLPCVI